MNTIAIAVMYIIAFTVILLDISIFEQEAYSTGQIISPSVMPHNDLVNAKTVYDITFMEAQLSVSTSLLSITKIPISF